jgi:hypothetical protein
MEDQTTEAEAIAAVPDEAADIARKLLDQIVAAHASCAANAAELGEPYSAHPISIEGDARAIVAAVTPVLAATAAKDLDDWAVGEPRVSGGNLIELRHNECGGVEYFDRRASDMLRMISVHDCSGVTL